MIVDQDKCGRADMERDRDNFSRMRLHGVDRTSPQDTISDEVVAAIQVVNPKVFAAEGRHVEPQIRDQGLGRPDYRSFDSID